MDTLRQIEKDFQEISEAAKKFINEHLEKKNIMYDMALCSELSGLMLLRAANKDISEYPPGTVIPGLIQEEEYEILNKFMMGFANSNKLNTKGYRKVKMDFMRFVLYIRLFVSIILLWPLPLHFSC
jgi:hypothetical protein